MPGTIEQFGFTAVPRSLDKLIATQSSKATSTPLSVDDIDFPKTALAASIHTYAKENLPRQTYNHSMRVYYYGKTHSQTFQLVQKEETNTITRRPRHRSTTLPLLEVQSRNPPPRRSAARHRHHARKPHLHSHLLRIRRRLPRARPPQVTPRRSRASRIRLRDDHPPPGSRRHGNGQHSHRNHPLRHRPR